MPLPVSMVRGRLKNETGVYYEGCFCNRYDGQRDWLGWHSDDDPGIDHSKPIAVVTLGQPRAIQYRPIEGTGPTREVLLEHGSLFVMAPGMQQTHMHRIPKAGHSVGTRISLTYRALFRQDK
jgi:alkylated DNA repair dioxygenase AlkB